MSAQCLQPLKEVSFQTDVHFSNSMPPEEDEVGLVEINQTRTARKHSLYVVQQFHLKPFVKALLVMKAGSSFER